MTGDEVVHVRRAGRCDICGSGDGNRKPGVRHVDEAAEEAKANTAPGGPLEFVHAGGRVIVPLESPSVEGQLRGAIFTAVVHGRPTLFDGPEGREAVLISRDRYAELVSRPIGSFVRLAGAQLDASLKQAMDACTTIGMAAAARIEQLAGSHGCEAAAEIAREQGRLDAAQEIAAAAARKEQS